METKQIIDISSSTIFRVILIILGLIFVYLIRDIIVVLFLGIILASAFEPVVGWLHSHKIPRIAGTLIVYLFIFLAISGIVYLIVPSLIKEVKDLAVSFPEIFQKTISQFEMVKGFLSKYQISENFQNIINTVESRLGTLASNAFSATINILGGVFSALVIVVISFYLLIKENGIDNFLKTVTPVEQRKMGRWFQGQLLLAFIVGTLVYLGLSILGIKFALTLAIIAAVFELIPYIGPVLAAIPAVVLAFFQFPLLALFVLILYIVIQQVENNIIAPQVIRKVVGLSPVVVILSLLTGAKLAGIVGLILAIPIASVIGEFFNDFLERKKEH